jgi:hypothetical protein
MAEKPSETTRDEDICEKCGGKFSKFCPNCSGINDIAKQIEKQASIICQKSANESNMEGHDYSNIPDNMHAVSPKKCFIEDMKDLPLAYCNKTKEAILNVLNHGGNPHTGHANVACELKSAVDPSHSTEVIIARSDSKYKISFQVANKGKYLLDIKVEGMHIEGSPFAINVIDNFDANIAVIISGVHHPQGIAINSRGEIIVVEYKKHCISIFNPIGNRIRSFGTKVLKEVSLIILVV